MPGNSKTGFTFIELLVVIMLMGIVATMIIPNLQQRLPGHQRKAFVNELNTLLAFGWQSALATQQVHKVSFDLNARKANLEVEEVSADGSTVVDKPVTQAYRKTSYEWPETIEIKNFYIDGVDDLGKTDRDVFNVWFYIVPEGLSQQIIMNVVDTSQTPQIELGLVLNPFTAQLKTYDTFQRP